jgi:hypothetical protein
MEQVAERKDTKEQSFKTKNSMELSAIKRTYITIDSHADIFKYVTIAIAIIGLIAGIIIGASIPVVKYGFSNIYYDEEKFNIAAMLITWGATAVASFGCWTIYCNLDSMDNMLMELKRANEYNRQNTEKE